MKKTLAIAGIVAVGILGLAGCSKATAEDRSSTAGGNNPDTKSDASHVDLYRNADGVPTVILFCIGDLRFASTASSLSDGGSSVAPSLLRLPEQDIVCKPKPR